MAFLVLLIIMVGGATRLTNSGLSIVHWSPISGIIPPFHMDDWQREFELYKKIPEYTLQNRGMTLSEFKQIFWWEWAHRILGRVIGLAVIIPLIVFAIAKKIGIRDIIPLLAVAILVGFQGLIGWWMVSSGLGGDMVDVASYRLAAHLGMGFILLGLLLFLARSYKIAKKTSGPKSIFWSLALILVFVQVILGAFTAGSHAGFGHSDWPKIDGNWLPKDYFLLSPLWHNFTHNTQAIQFNHRMMAYFIFIVLLANRFRDRFSAKTKHQKLANLALLTCTAQGALGIALLTVFTKFTPPNPIGVNFGVAHQALAAIFFGVTVLAWQTSEKKIS